MVQAAEKILTKKPDPKDARQAANYKFMGLGTLYVLMGEKDALAKLEAFPPN